MTTPPNEPMSPERIGSLRDQLREGDTRATDLLGPYIVFDSRTSCDFCTRRIREGYPYTPTGFLCEECGVARLIRSLLALIPDEALPIHTESSSDELIDKAASDLGVITEWSSSDPAPDPKLFVKPSAFSSEGSGVVRLKEGDKVDVLSMPPGTILKFGPVKHTPDPPNSLDGGDVVVRERDEFLAHESVIRPWSPPDEEWKPGGDTPDGGYAVATRPRNLEEVKLYEAAHGDQELIALLEAEDAEWEAQKRLEMGDRRFEQHFGRKDKIARVGGVGVLRMNRSKEERDAIRSEAVPSSESSFPSLAPQRLRP